VTNLIRSWSGAWYSTMGTAHIKYKRAGNSTSRYGEKNA